MLPNNIYVSYVWKIFRRFFLCIIERRFGWIEIYQSEWKTCKNLLIDTNLKVF